MTRFIPWLLVLLALAGCATIPSPEHAASSIGPYPQFSGRLLVIEPNRRWQVAIDWQAETPEHGQLRLTHAASGIVVELAWEQHHMRLRDSSQPLFREVTQRELHQHGIFIAPWTLAAILLGDMPREFHPAGDHVWETHQAGALIRLQWDVGHRRLTLTDTKHGRQATLLINA